jgi:hypothetical protein
VLIERASASVSVTVPENFALAFCVAHSPSATGESVISLAGVKPCSSAAR